MELSDRESEYFFLGPARQIYNFVLGAIDSLYAYARACLIRGNPERLSFPQVWATTIHRSVLLRA
jgi:hypothetical protein